MTDEELTELERQRLTLGLESMSDLVRHVLLQGVEPQGDPMWALVHLLERHLKERTPWAAPKLFPG